MRALPTFFRMYRYHTFSVEFGAMRNMMVGAYCILLLVECRYGNISTIKTFTYMKQQHNIDVFGIARNLNNANFTGDIDMYKTVSIP